MAPQVTLDLAALGRDVDRLAGQVAGDVGQQPAGDQHPAGLAHVGGHGDPGRDLVVEGRQGQRALGVGLEQDAGEDRHRRAVRQAASGPATASASASRSTWNFTCHRPSGSGPWSPALRHAGPVRRPMPARGRQYPPEAPSGTPTAPRGPSWSAARHSLLVRRVPGVHPFVSWTLSGDMFIRGSVIFFFGAVDPVDNRHRRRSRAAAACGWPGGDGMARGGRRWTGRGRVPLSFTGSPACVLS